jgi:hypothetical protein
MSKFMHALLVAASLFALQADAAVIRGYGSNALVKGDLTDPENDGNPEANVGYNATFRSSVEPGFGGGEYAFNVFDNQVGAWNDKWCCDWNVWVEADFGTKAYVLTSFTASSANDVPGRDSDKWAILGSNDGVNYTTIFSYDQPWQSPWASRLQVNEYKAGVDYATPAAYTIFRYQSMSTVDEWSGMHQLAELEFFGTEAADVPEPTGIALLGLGALALAASRRRKRA